VAALEPAAPAEPPDAEPTPGRIDLPSLGPLLDNPQAVAARVKRQEQRQEQRLAQLAMQQETQRSLAQAAARQAPAPAQAAAAQPVPVVAVAAGPAAAADTAAVAPAGLPAAAPAIAPAIAPVRAAPAAPTTGTVYALATRRLRTTAESEQLQAAMRSLLHTPGAAPLRVDALPEGKDWRVVSWPFATRSSAEQARAQLVARGLKVDVIDF
jgi:hypothetical protein